MLSLTDNKKRKLRDALRLISALLFSWLYIPHILAFLMTKPAPGGGQ